jgi:hypothetical protein
MSRSQRDVTEEVPLPGASEEPRRVKVLNVYWVADDAWGDGQFAVFVVTNDDERYTMPASPGSMTALVARAKADMITVWDPENRSLILDNNVGTMPWTGNGSI